ncbi:class I SAM-dependent methyltransferase [Frankia sp. AgB1.9]|uniref:class I SAM-dependent methyltransferase n=1 Tax=unclassified Frankia TaxID=2632575 RepID=UPI0019330302|nr:MULTISPECIES: class I SAM-dependent methyltransferase [unclassified Frankia]MBL7490754.1 class I SAM-dependent methyltransferase [Frankia sp. AgW1.1]MBL7549883.1 class I SAM-dependent methyltransferase [Frankia sp. AgB1.9]MBL7623001.1 class I SAM-dependent methyltransferase [Frankia sp. AgB1.8]
MQAEGGSRTAVLTCQGRAVADGSGAAGRFADTVALDLLRPDERLVVEQVRAGTPPKGAAARMAYESAKACASVMVPRTIAADDAIRDRPGGVAPQLVLLGAGLDARAWRMPELAGTDVFEVDHPASQRDKRDRLAGRPPLARSLTFVPVDFSRDKLAEALAAAGFQTSKPTTWVWEGVVPYLTPAEVSATTAAAGELSAPGSRLVVLYLAPNARASAGVLVARAMSLLARQRSVWADEPRRSAWTAPKLAALLATHGFAVTRDESLLSISERLALPNTRGASIAHAHLAVADR